MDPSMGATPAVFAIGPVLIARSVVTTWVIMLVLGAASRLATRRLRAEGPGTVQALLEGAVVAIDETVRGVIPDQADLVRPFIGTLWVFVVVANLCGIVPGLESPTADISVTAGLALLVFLSVHWFGLRSQGPGRYFRHYLSPSPVMLPFHVISELTRTVALAVRLFGNIMSLEMAAILVLAVAGFLVPIPLLMLHIVEALIQAYIFGMLALLYIAGAIQSQQLKGQAQEE
jgi:F-type H+-transporting ATPase subunit a